MVTHDPLTSITLSHYGARADGIKIVTQAYLSNQATTLTNLIDNLPS